MKILNFIAILAICFFSFVSCDDEDYEAGISESETPCESNLDCPNIGDKCDLEKKICTNGSESKNGGSDGNNSGEDGENGGGEDGNSGDNNTPGEQDGDNDPITGRCEPGKKQTCDYEGPAGTEGKGDCKAAVRTCDENGKWGPCEGEIIPVYEAGELCYDGKDNDCNGVVDDGTDVDGDGHGACSDCCETTNQCADPKSTWDINNKYHYCSYKDVNETCDYDNEVSASSTNPFDYAKAIGICKVKNPDNPNDWGLISAKISAPDGSTDVHKESSGLLLKLGKVIKPKEGGLMLGLSSGKVTDPFTTESGTITSGAPSDWLDAQDPKGKFPAAKSCSSSGTSGKVNDAVMLTLEIKTPPTAKSFSFNIYFLTKEYSTYICSQYNDFFIALLDSDYESDDPALQNPKDKNLAMDEKGNPVGINLAASGLFKQCKKQSTVSNSYGTFDATSCTGTEELQGTGFESNGGTGWLTTRGNVKGGEIIKLRLAIWDLVDHGWDSLVLIDNFRWDAAEHKPGTGL